MIKNLKDKQIWVFDVDNTLYHEDANLFVQIEKRMGLFIQQRLDCDSVSARTLQKKYFAEYGTTMSGLMKHHNVDPYDYMDFVHDIDYKVLPKNPYLANAIQALPGRKIIYTNGSKNHAFNVLEHLDIDVSIFDQFFDISDCNFIPKNKDEAYDIMIKAAKFDPKFGVMVEDLGQNLIYPKKLGMATLLVESSIKIPTEIMPIIDHITDDLAGFLGNYHPEKD